MSSGDPSGEDALARSVQPAAQHYHHHQQQQQAMLAQPGQQYWIDGLNSPATPIMQQQLLYYQPYQQQPFPAPDPSTLIAYSSAASPFATSMYPSSSPYMWQQQQHQRLPLFVQRQENVPPMQFPPPSPQYTFNFSRPVLPPRSLQDDIAMLASRFTAGQFAASSPAAAPPSSQSGVLQLPRTLPHRPRPGPFQPRIKPRSISLGAESAADERQFSPTSALGNRAPNHQTIRTRQFLYRAKTAWWTKSRHL